jgi:hypothetical protein
MMRPERRRTRTEGDKLRSAVLLLAAACSPVTQRPAFAPFPEAPAAVLNAPPLRVQGEVQAWLTDQGLQFEIASLQDRYLETAWYDTNSRRSRAGRGEGLPATTTFKVRCWIDPDAPGRAKLTVEAVVRPTLDPSRSERDLEVLAPADHPGRLLADRLLGELKKKLGTS